MIIFWIQLISLMAFAEPYLQEESVIELPQRTQKPILIQHRYGKVLIRGWVQDRIRVRMKKKIWVEAGEETKDLLNRFQLRSLETTQNFEIRVSEGLGHDIVTKLRDRNMPKIQKVSVDLEIDAPHSAALTLSTLGGDPQSDVMLSDWRGALDLSLSGGELSLERVRLRGDARARVSCFHCNVTVKSSTLSGSFILGVKPVFFFETEFSPDLFLETQSGDVRIEKTKGVLSFVSKKGRLSGNHQGTLMVKTELGDVDLRSVKGDFAVSSIEGDLQVHLGELNRSARLSSEKGNVTLFAPPDLSARIELSSGKGEVVTQFALEKEKGLFPIFGPEMPGKMKGTTGRADRGREVVLQSKEGGVWLNREKMK